MTTSYENTGGTGDRRGIISATENVTFYYGNITLLINGSMADETCFGSSNIAVSGKFLRFDFGAGVTKIIDEFKWIQETNQDEGEWKVQGSNDGTNWTDLSGTLSLVTAATTTHAFSNTTGYRYYQLLGVSGLCHWNPWLREIEFKIGEEVPDIGGIVFGGEVLEIVTAYLTDGATSGGIVFGSSGDISTPENNQVDGETSGGIVFGGQVNEQWVAEPNNLVAVKGGTYRISGVIYTLAVTMSYAGLGDIAALVNCGVAPAVAGTYRYDLLSVGAAGTIVVTAGAESTTPVMPTTPASSVKLDHVLRYYGQTSIVQSDIGKIWLAPALATLEAVIADDELAWAELSTTITITCRDQYGQLFTGNKTVNAAFESGNGTIAPLLRSGGASSFVFTYTRGGVDPGDISPMLTFSSPTGPLCVASILLFNAGGTIMI